MAPVPHYFTLLWGRAHLGNESISITPVARTGSAGSGEVLRVSPTGEPRTPINSPGDAEASIPALSAQEAGP